jgi:hypothetical protein
MTGMNLLNQLATRVLDILEGNGPFEPAVVACHPGMAHAASCSPIVLSLDRIKVIPTGLILGSLGRVNGDNVCGAPRGRLLLKGCTTTRHYASDGDSWTSLAVVLSYRTAPWNLFDFGAGPREVKGKDGRPAYEAIDLAGLLAALEATAMGGGEGRPDGGSSPETWRTLPGLL